MMIPAIALMLVTPMLAQSNSSDNKPAETKPSAKTKKVWTNEDLGGLGGINVVGKSVPSTKPNPTRAGRPSAASAPEIAAGIDRPRPVGPPFTATSLDGQNFTTDSVGGKVVLVQFWATWCAVCKKNQPAVDALAQRSNLVVLAVTAEGKDVVQNYLNGYPRAVNVVLGRDTNLPQLFPHPAYPYYVVIDGDGNVVTQHRGYASAAKLDALLSSAGL